MVSSSTASAQNRPPSGHSPWSRGRWVCRDWDWVGRPFCICSRCEGYKDSSSSLPSDVVVSNPDATGEPPGRPRMHLPEGQQPPAKASSKEAPDRQLMRGDQCMLRPHLFL